MKWLWITAILFLSGMTLHAQEEDEEYTEDTEAVDEENEKKIIGKEIGFDVNLSASTLGGTGGLGVKLGFLVNDNLIVGPSVRYQSSWVKNQGPTYSFASYGGGAFIHYRCLEYLFVGAELEFLSTPLQYGLVSSGRSFIPTCLIGLGFSHNLNPNLRLNAGLMYDVIDHQNSPLRQGYFVRNSNNVLLPFVYRIAFFIPL